MTRTYAACDIARELERLFAFVDGTDVDWGHGLRSSCLGDEHLEGVDVGGGWTMFGWYDDNGVATGNVLMTIANADMHRAGEVLAGMGEIGFLRDIERAFLETGVRFENMLEGNRQ
ncbi:MAG TPA: hypothetical protein VH592_14135 [Gemmataceae bacterium]|jgi:hypothetical protein